VTGGITTLVLAGSRGAEDPVAKHAGLSHKAVVPVAGTPMLARVLETLLASRGVGCIGVSIERPELVEGLPGMAAHLASGRVRVLPAAGSPARSVLATLATCGTPLFVTTADHALLTPAMVEHFLYNLPPDADVAAGLARAETIRAAYPETQRTYLRFPDLTASGCNLFAFRTPHAKGVAEFWRAVEQNRKQPLKMIRLLGLWHVLRFAAGRLTFAAVVERLEELTEARIGWVDMPFAEAAIDVDKPADLELAEVILRRRAALPSA